MMGKQLSFEQRCEIERLIAERVRQAEVARLLGVHRSTVCNEIKRNSVGGVYVAVVAQEMVKQRQLNKRKRGRNGEYQYQM